jgi:hypothetical protein
LLSAIPVLNPRERRARTFLTRDQITAAIPRLPGAGPAPALVQVAPGHLVQGVAS